MKGIILDYSTQENKGAIITEDGDRYYFSGADWKSNSTPQKGTSVDFEAGQDKQASMVYLDIKQVNTENASSFGKKNTESTVPDYEIENKYTIADWAKKAIGNYSNFSGRARRKEFWSFYLVMTIIIIIATIVDTILGFDLFSCIAILITYLLSISVTIRRLHDINISGILTLFCFIPLFGSIFSIVIGCIETKGTYNEWGAPAKKLTNH
ncbi:TPA: DUF805 domain-containing protein [Escherichia coli]|nr:DUF805 domain-containing protein [Escherichia coli]